MYLNYNTLLIGCQVVKLHKDTMLLLYMLHTINASSVTYFYLDDYHLFKILELSLNEGILCILPRYITKDAFSQLASANWVYQLE